MDETAHTLILRPALDFDTLDRELAAHGWMRSPIPAATAPMLPGEPELAHWTQALQPPGDMRLVYTMNPVLRLRVLRVTGRDAAAHGRQLARALHAQDPASLAASLAADDPRERLRGVLAAGALAAHALLAPMRALILDSEPTVAQAAARVHLDLLRARATELSRTLLDQQAQTRQARQAPQARQAQQIQADLAQTLEAIAHQALPVLAALPSAGEDAILGLQPTAEDCAEAFRDAVASDVYAAYDQLWTTPPRVTPSPAQQEIQVHACPVALLGTDHPLAVPLARKLPEGYRALAPYLRPGRVWLAWRYTKPGTTAGLAFDGLVHVRGAWVWFPKPHRVVGTILRARAQQAH